MSPTKRRTEQWLQGHTTARLFSGLILRKTKNGRIVRKKRLDQRKKRASFWNLSFWFSGSSKDQSDRPEEDDLEGDTFIDDATSTADTSYENDLTLVVDDYDERVKGDDAAHTLQNYNDGYLDYDDPRIQDWTEEEKWLFTKLANRGYEPLLHSTWIMDYATFPDQLFTNDESQVYINNIHSSTGRGTQPHSKFSPICITANNQIPTACRSLTDLIMASSRVRDQILSKTATERPLFHAVNNYYKWTLADAKVQRKDFIPVVAIATAKGQ